MRRSGFMLLAGALLVGRAAAHDQSAGEEHVRGDVLAVQGDALTVTTRSGQPVTVELPKNVAVAHVQTTTLDAIERGVFVGATTVPERDGTLRAVEVHIFPESMRGTGEGSRRWDLPSGSSMTNATVATTEANAPPGSTMTNATVANVRRSGAGRKIELKYSGERKTVIVPPGAPVVKLEPAAPSALKPGAHVFAVTKRQPDGKLLAQRILVGEGDVRPPM